MDEPLPQRCSLYKPGHEVHWIQSWKSLADEVDVPELGLLLRVADDGALAVLVGGVVWHLWNHQPERVPVLAGRNDNVVWLQRRWHLLRTESPQGHYVFCVDALDGDHDPCPEERLDLSDFILTMPGGRVLRKRS